MADELDQTDQMAVAWAWTTGSPSGRVLQERRERGGSASPTDDDLVAIRREWEAAGRPPPDLHVHRTVVDLPDGTAVTAVSFVSDDPYLRDATPAFGLYLDARWDPPWPHQHVTWPDFGVPDPAQLATSLEQLLARAREGDAVELGCLGGHGRTGTALACLAVLTGVPRDQAVDWVRSNYCSHAVETPGQRAFVEHYGE